MVGIGILGLAPTPSCLGTASSIAPLVGVFIHPGVRTVRHSSGAPASTADTAATATVMVTAIIRIALVPIQRTGGQGAITAIPRTMVMAFTTLRVLKAASPWVREMPLVAASTVAHFTVVDFMARVASTAAAVPASMVVAVFTAADSVAAASTVEDSAVVDSTAVAADLVEAADTAKDKFR